MKTPPPITVLAVIFAVLMLAVVVGALLRMPPAAPARVIYVNVEQ